jgi:uncharacterized protein YbaR (Trm112 family)
MESNKTTTPQPLDDWFIALLACPGCEQRHPVMLSQDKSSLFCACGKYSFPVTDGIPVLLMDCATVLDENANPDSVSEESVRRAES